MTATAAKVRRPVHVLYYRVAQGGAIEIVRVLHERMEPSRHLDGLPTEGDV
jgi:toxin ParE1/3/4